jgi:hypothetical protein
MASTFSDRGDEETTIGFFNARPRYFVFRSTMLNSFSITQFANISGILAKFIEIESPGKIGEPRAQARGDPLFFRTFPSPKLVLNNVKDLGEGIQGWGLI